MCVLTILPTEDNSFLLTSNRDESAYRSPATYPEIRVLNGINIMMPVDQHAGGTWLATAENGRTVCLLNGAFKRHKHEPPYRKSRGLVVLDSFSYANIDDFFSGYDLDAIEPFTMVVLEKLDPVRLCEIRWDGNKKYVKNFDHTQPLIWSSAMLYLPEVILARQKRFTKWLQEGNEFTSEAIRAFHHSEKYDPVTHQNDAANKYKLQTMSITSIELNAGESLMRYEDLLKETVEDNVIDLLRG